MQSSHTLGRSRSSRSERLHPSTIALVIAAAIGVWGCGGSPASSPPPATPPTLLISVTVTPNSVTVVHGATQPFAAMVTGTTNTAVTWSVQEASGGTIDSAGLFTAPQQGDGTFHVVATSQANSAAKGIAAVVVPMAQVTISPAAVTLLPGGSRTFAAAVTGFANT